MIDFDAVGTQLAEGLRILQDARSRPAADEALLERHAEWAARTDEAVGDAEGWVKSDFADEVTDATERPTDRSSLLDVLFAQVHRLAVMLGDSYSPSDHGTVPAAAVQHYEGCDAGLEQMAQHYDAEGHRVFECPACGAESESQTQPRQPR